MRRPGRRSGWLLRREEDGFSHRGWRPRRVWSRVGRVVPWRASPSREARQEVELEDLDEKAAKRCMKPHGRAIDTLEKRGLLADEDLDALKERPLGRLYLDGDA